MLVPLVVTLIFGFATNLHVVYGAVSDYYSTIFGALRMAAVYLLGGHHLLLVSRLIGGLCICGPEMFGSIPLLCSHLRPSQSCKPYALTV